MKFLRSLFYLLLALSFSLPFFQAKAEVSVETEKMLQILAEEQFELLQRTLESTESGRSLSIERKSAIEEAMRLQIRAIIKSKTLGTYYFESLVQNYPDFVGFQIVYNITKTFIVSPVLLKFGYGWIVAALAFIPENYPIYGALQVFRSWYDENKMRKKYNITEKQRDLLLSEYILKKDYKNFTMHILKNEGDALVVPLTTKDKSEVEEFLHVKDLERIINDPRYIKDLQLMSMDNMIYQNTLLNVILQSEEMQPKLMEVLSEKTTFSHESAILMAELFKTQKVIRMMSVKFSSVNFLTWFRKKSREHFFEQRRVTLHLAQVVQQLEEIKWKIASFINSDVPNDMRIPLWREEIKQIEMKAEEYVRRNMQYSKVTTCNSVFDF